VLAEACKYHQINRFIFASTCSVYGASKSPDDRLDEKSPLNPVSLYAEMKLKSENGLFELMDDNFSPTILRLSTVYGWSPRMRFDLVVNILTAKAIFDKKITIFGGEQWRPNVSVKDVANAFITCIESPIDKVGGEIFNVGSDKENYKIKELGEIIHTVIPHADVETIENEDDRNYRIDFTKISKVLGYKTQHTIAESVAEIKSEIDRGLVDDYESKKYSNYKSLSGE